MRLPPSLVLPLASLVFAASACGTEAPPKAEPTTPESASAAPAPSVAESTAPVPGAAASSASVPGAAASSASVPGAAASSASTPSASAASAAPSSPPKKITARHILIQWMGCQSTGPSVVRTKEQARVVALEVLRRVKAGEDFARLVVDYSDEPNAGARGGSLGRFGRGAMVKEFEDAAFSLKPGEVSDIVESPFGFHVIQRLD